MQIYFFNLSLFNFLSTDLTFMDLGKLAKDGCNEECIFGKDCIKRADWYEAYNLRVSFWGNPNEDPYMPRKRLEKITDIYKLCEAAKVN